MSLWDKTEDQQKQHAKMLDDCIKVLNNHNIYHYVSGSALIGYEREGDFIKWCPGIVLNVRTSQISIKQESIIKGLMENGFEIKRHFKGSRNWKIRIDKGLLNIEITGYFRNGENYYRKQGRIYKNIPAKLFDSIIKSQIRGVNIMIPEKHIEMLDHMYIDWRSPIRSKKHKKYKSEKFLGIKK